MKITANAKTYEIADGLTVAEFVGSVGLDASKCVVELNGKAMRFDIYKDIVLHDGDVLEIMQIVAGG